VSTATAQRDLSPAEFAAFRDLVQRLTGIHHPGDKLPLLSERVRRRLRATGEPDYASYLERVQQDGAGGEMQQLVDAVVTNETCFLRCARHWELVSAWAAAQAQRPEVQRRGLRIWSAATSTGAEAFSVLIALEQALGEGFGGLRVEVLGTDVSAAALAQARAGRYGERALRELPPAVRQRWFTPAGDGEFQFAERLLPFARFELHNLMAPLQGRAFDLVLLRNVLIYFDRAAKARALLHASAALPPGGRLLIGECESLLDVDHGLVRVERSLYAKPDVGARCPRG
jgi:chemotaxis protein methyltransferase CheR